MASGEVGPDEFVMLLARHGGRVRAFVATLVGFDAEAIDEIVQSTTLVAWRKLDGFRYEGASADEELVRWLCTIARFEMLSYVRDKKRREAVCFDDGLVGELADLQEEESTYFNARRLALRDCLRKLEPKQLESLRMRYGVGLSMAEIATRQRRSVKAATVAIGRIRRALEGCIRQTLLREGAG